MELEVFREAHVHLLQGSIFDNIQRYKSGKPWAQRKSGAGPSSFPSGLTPAVPLDFHLPTAKSLCDFENSVLLHKAFPSLSRAQASDPRLWVRLTHVEGWQYMRKRWDASDYIGEDDEQNMKATKWVAEHYFVASSSPSRALTRNGMARLWWYASLTHDPKRNDAYELTRVLLSQLDIAQSLLERNFGRAPCVRSAFLDYIRDNEGRLGETSGQKRDHIRFLAKGLNMQGGLSLLDSLDANGVYQFLASESRRWEASED